MNQRCSERRFGSPVSTKRYAKLLVWNWIEGLVIPRSRDAAYLAEISPTIWSRNGAEVPDILLYTSGPTTECIPLMRARWRPV